MKPIIQSQREWKEFSTEGNVGIITTMFSEQFLSKSFNVIPLSVENYKDEIELYGIDTVFVDNDLFESDHPWYKQGRGHLVNFLKNNDINICVILNTSIDIFQVFKKAFVLKVNSNITKYQFDGLVLNVPMQIDTVDYNPVNSSKTLDITYYCIGKMNSSAETRTFNSKFKPKIKIISEPRFSRHNLKKFSSFVKKSKVLYICNSKLIDEITLEYIEKIAYLNSTNVVYDYTFENIKPKFGFYTPSDKTNFNRIRVLRNNSLYAFKSALSAQRKILNDHTFLLLPSLEEFLSEGKNEKIIPEISIITSTNRKSSLHFYFEQINKQINVNLEINLVTHGFELTEKEKIQYQSQTEFPVSFTSAHSAENLGNCLNKAVEKSTFPVIAKIDDDDFYLENYIIDQWMALQYSDAEVVGKSEAFYYFEEEDIIARRKIGEYYKYDHFIMGATIMSKASTLKQLKFADLPKAIDTNFLRRVVEIGGEIYIGHPFEMCVYRSADDSHHTWQVDDLAMMRTAEIVGYGNPRAVVNVK